jgi:hypothetical protein
MAEVGRGDRKLAGCAALHIETARLDCFEQLTRAVTQIPFKPPEPRVSKSQGSARDVPTVSPSEAANHIGEEVVVEGVISDVGYSARSDTTFLNMGGKYPNHPPPSSSELPSPLPGGAVVGGKREDREW